MRAAFKPPQMIGKTTNVPAAEISGPSRASDWGVDMEVVMAIATKLQGAVSAARGTAPPPNISNPECCKARNARTTAIQYPPAIIAGAVWITLEIVGLSKRFSANLASQSLSNLLSSLVSKVLHKRGSRLFLF